MPNDPSKLRRQAEARLGLHAGQGKPDASAASAAAQRSQHELEVHQVELELQNNELELQNEELQAARAEIEAAQLRYQELFDFAPASYFNLSADGTILLANRSAEALVGVPREQLAGRRFGFWVCARDRGAFADFVCRSFAGGSIQTCEVDLEFAEGRSVPVRIQATPSRDGSECRLVVFDLTQSRLAEAQLRASEAFNISVLDSLADHIAVIDEHGVILAVNRAWRQFGENNGLPAGTAFAVGLNYFGVCASSAHHFGCAEAATAEAGIRAVLSGRSADFQMEYECHSPDALRWFDKSVTPLVGGRVGAVIRRKNITRHKQVAAALARTSSLLERTGELAKVGGWELDLRTSGLYWSLETCRIHEVDPESPPTLETAINFYAPEARPVIAAAVRECVEHGTPWDLKLPLITAKGRRILVRAQGSAIQENGRVIKLSGAFQDITEIEQVADSLRQSALFLRTITDHNPGVVGFWNRELRCTFANSAYQTWFGRASGEMPGIRMQDLLGPELFAKNEPHIRAVLRGEDQQFERRLTRFDGKVCDTWVQYIAYWVDVVFQGFFVLLTDITQVKAAENALITSERRWRAIIDASPVPMALSEEQYRNTYCNPAFIRAVGYTLEDIPTLDHWRSLAYPDPVYRRHIQETWQAELRRAGQSGTHFRPIELRVHCKDGSEKIFLSIAAPFSGPLQVEYLIVFFDITAQMQAQSALAGSREQLRSLARSLQVIREEERTSIAREIHDVLAQELTRLKLDLAWLGRRLGRPVDEPARATLAAKLQEMSELATVTSLSVQKLATSLRPVVLDTLGLGAAIKWLLDDFQKRTGIQCVVRVAADLPEFGGAQATALFRIVQESLTNVIRHAGARNLEVNLAVEANRLNLTIRDDGRGITSAQLNDPQSIGLLGMKERAAVLGGDLELICDESGGTVVRVNTPLPGASQSGER